MMVCIKVNMKLLAHKVLILKFSSGSHKDVINFCANNYLGLANDNKLIETGKRALDNYGLGTTSVRFICRNSRYK